MRILVPGANGQVGQNLVSLGGSYGMSVVGLKRDQLDITSFDSIDAAFKNLQPDLVINAAAYTAVDNAETDSESAFRINETGAQLLAEACVSAGIPLFHISTDYVFDGSLDRPYTEMDKVSPCGVYGQSKEAGERRIRSTMDNHIIVRTSWVFSKEGNCFPKAILRAAGQRDQLKVVADQLGGPTSAKSIAGTLLSLAKKYRDEGVLNWGTYHYSQKPYVTWHQFAVRILELAETEKVINHKVVVNPCASSEYPVAVDRPLNSRLDTTKLEALLDTMAFSWEDDLLDLVASQEKLASA